MKTVLAAATLALALTACQRSTGETPAPAADIAAEDAASVDGASGSAGAPTASATAADTAGADTAAITPAENASMAAPTTAAGPGPVTDATRDGAKTKAEETNLHP